MGGVGVVDLLDDLPEDWATGRHHQAMCTHLSTKSEIINMVHLQILIQIQE